NLPCEIPDYSAYAVFLLYHLSCYSTSLIEEEHDTWYYISSTITLYQIFVILKYSAKSKWSFELFHSDSRLQSGIILLSLHRLAMSFTSHTRRRWSMRPDLLPPPIFPEFRFDIESLDYLTSDLNLSAISK
ncbi:hypothetical protein GCK32_009151, partial [Trichostrongylus colubriformis]